MRERLAKQSVAQAALTKLNKQRAAVMSEAKSQLGLWSDAGIEESRATFWCDSLAYHKAQSAVVPVMGQLQTQHDCLCLMIAIQAQTCH